jgi:hypothetical protein
MASRLIRSLALSPLLLLTAAEDDCTIRILLDGTEPLQSANVVADDSNGGGGRCGDAGEVHVVGIYETIGRSGDATVHVDRPGPVSLVLSSYEPTRWRVTTGPDTELRGISVSSYEDRSSVVVGAGADVAVNTLSGPDGMLGCAYELPDTDPTSGCETGPFLSAVAATLGQTVSAFHGCYAANDFVIDSDGASTSDCDVDAGYGHSSAALDLCDGDVGDDPGACASGGFGFAAASFDAPRDELSCDGEQRVRFDDRFGLWVGVTRCEGSSVRVYLSDREEGPFLPATDTAGNGQDHCELINPAFTSLPNEDDITSGGCAACSTGVNLPLEGVGTWTRANLGEPFARVTSSEWSWQTSVLDCGIDVDVCAAGGDVVIQ